MRNYFWEDEPITKIKVTANNSKVSTPTTITILPKSLPVEHHPEYSITVEKEADERNRIMDINEFRLGLAKTKLLPKINFDLPTIRSATNVPRNNLLRNGIKSSLTRNNLPIIRPAENVPGSVPVTMDMNEFRLGLAKTKLRESETIRDDIPTIRSATNIPRHNFPKNAIRSRLIKNDLPIIRSADNVNENLPLIRSDRSRLLSIRPFNSLNFLASRIRSE